MHHQTVQLRQVVRRKFHDEGSHFPFHGGLAHEGDGEHRHGHAEQIQREHEQIGIDARVPRGDAPQTAARMGALAPQVKKGMTRLVMVRSFSSARVRVLMTAGTEQPKPMIMGMNALPESPNLRKARSK